MSALRQDFYFVNCDQCKGKRAVDGVICRKCNGEGGFRVPANPPLLPILDSKWVRLVLFIIAVAIAAAVSLFVVFR